MASVHQLRDVRMACVFEDRQEFSHVSQATTEDTLADCTADVSEDNATLVDILRPCLEAQRAQVIADLNGSTNDPATSGWKSLDCESKDDHSDCSIEDIVSIGSIYDFIDKEYDCIQQAYSGASSCTESCADLTQPYTGSRTGWTDHKDIYTREEGSAAYTGSSRTRSAWTDTTSSTYTASVLSGSADSAIGLGKAPRKKDKVPECRSDMLLWKDLDVAEGMGLVCMPNGNVAVSDFEAHEIIVYNELGIRVSSSKEGTVKLSCPRGLSYHPHEGALLVTEWTKGRVLMLSSDARKRLRRINVSMRPFGVAVLSTGDLVVVGMFKQQGTWSGGVAVVDLKGKEKRRWRGGLDKPWDVAVGPRDAIYVTDFRSHCISVFTPEGRRVRRITGGPYDDLSFPKGLCFLDDLLLVSHDVTSISGGKASRLSAWTRHGRHLGAVLNWPGQSGCRLRGVALCDDILVGLGTHKVLTYKLTYRDIIHPKSQKLHSALESQDTLKDTCDDNCEYTTNRQLKLLPSREFESRTRSKVQRVAPLVRPLGSAVSADNLTSENEEDFKEVTTKTNIFDTEAENEPYKGSLFSQTLPAYSTSLNVKKMEDNPYVIYQRGIKYFRGFNSGKTYNPMYMPVHDVLTTSQSEDSELIESPLTDYDSFMYDSVDSAERNGETSRPSAYSRESYCSSQANMSTPDPCMYHSHSTLNCGRSSIATRSEPYSPCQYNLPAPSPAYVDLYQVRSNTLPRSSLDIHQDSQLGQLHQPSLMRRYAFSPVKEILPPTPEIIERPDSVTVVYDDVSEEPASRASSHTRLVRQTNVYNRPTYGLRRYSMYDDNIKEIANAVNKNPDGEQKETSPLETYCQEENKPPDKAIHTLYVLTNGNKSRAEETKECDIKQASIGQSETTVIDHEHDNMKPVSSIADLKISQTEMNSIHWPGLPSNDENPVKPYVPHVVVTIPEAPPLLLKPSTPTSKQVGNPLMETATNIPNEIPKLSDSGMFENVITSDSTQSTISKTENSDIIPDREINSLASSHTPEHSGKGVKPTPPPVPKKPVIPKLNHNYNMSHLTPKPVTEVTPVKQKTCNNLEETTKLLNYKPSSPAQALAKILNASVARPVWEGSETTDDEGVSCASPGSTDESHFVINELVQIASEKSQEHQINLVTLPIFTVNTNLFDATDSSNHPAEKEIVVEALPMQTPTSSYNTIQRGKPNTYQLKPVVSKNKYDSDSLYSDTSGSSSGSFRSTSEHPNMADGNESQENSQGNDEGYSERLLDCDISPVPAKPDPSIIPDLVSSALVIPPIIRGSEETKDPSEIGDYVLPPVKYNTSHDVQIPVLTTPDHPPPTCQIFSPPPDSSEVSDHPLPPPYVQTCFSEHPNNFNPYECTTHQNTNTNANTDTGQSSLENAIPISRVINKHYQDLPPFSPSPEELDMQDTKDKTGKSLKPARGRNIAALNSFLKKAIQTKIRSNLNQGVVVLSDEDEDNSETIKSNFRHSFCTVSKALQKPSKKQLPATAASRTVSNFHRRNTICGISVLKANCVTAKAKGGIIPYSEV